jgi:DNA-binding NarL/FixJ family response regulator
MRGLQRDPCALLTFLSSGCTLVENFFARQQRWCELLRATLIKKGLSVRESEVAEEVSKGFTNQEIADRLHIAETTVKFHITSIFKKLNIKNRANLILACVSISNQQLPNSGKDVINA